MLHVQLELLTSADPVTRPTEPRLLPVCMSQVASVQELVVSVVLVPYACSPTADGSSNDLWRTSKANVSCNNKIPEHTRS